MKLSIAVTITMLCAAGLYADHDYGKGVGHDKDKKETVTKGPKGDSGDRGPKGDAGRDGRSGEKGQDGRDGLDGQSPNTASIENALHDLQETQYVVQGEIRVLDYRKFGASVFAGYDVRHTRNNQIGARLIYKLGKSYEERRIEKLQAQIETLKEALGLRVTVAERR